MNELAISGKLSLPLYDNVTMYIGDIKQIKYNMYDDIIAGIEESLRNEYDWKSLAYNEYTLKDIIDMLPSNLPESFSLNMSLSYYFLDRLETNRLEIMSVDLMCVNTVYMYKAYLKIDLFDFIDTIINPMIKE